MDLVSSLDLGDLFKHKQWIKFFPLFVEKCNDFSKYCGYSVTYSLITCRGAS